MKARFTGLHVIKYENRYYPYGYTMDLQPEGQLTQEAISTIQPNGNTDLLTPTQVEWILRLTPDRYDEDGKLYAKMQWFKYGFTEMFPVITLDSKHITNYSDIPMYITDVDALIVEDKSQWATYLSSVTMDFLAYFTDMPYDQDWISYDLYGMDFDPMLRYNKLSQVKSFGVQDDYQKKLQEMNEEHARIVKEKYDNIAKMENEKPELTYPFTYDKTLPHLVIPKDAPTPNFRLVLELMREIQQTYGLCMELSGLREYKRQLYVEVGQYEAKFKEAFGLTFIDTNKRLFSEQHPHFKFFKFIGENPYDYKTGNNITLKKSVRENLLQKVKDNFGEQSEQYRMAVDYHEYLNIINGPLKVGKPILNSVDGHSVAGVTSEIDEENGIIRFKCGMELVKTNRVTTNKPNIQGQTKVIKSFITGARKGRKILSIDIKAQEVMILIFGVLQNDRLKKLVLQNKDPYKSFAICAGLCDEDTFTPQLKSLIKVPVLSVMNGKSERNIKAELAGNEHVAEVILELITQDPGYKRIEAVAREEQRKCSRSRSYNVVRRGLFGTEKSEFDAEQTGSPFTQSINANFQMTASEILCYGLNCMIMDLGTQDNKYDLTIDQLTPLITIYDEVIFEYDEDIEEQAVELVNFYICPQVEGWLEMSGSITTGENYVYKE